MSFNTLQDLFGENAQLTADQLIIAKADLAKVGLNEYPNDLAAILVALVLNAKASFKGVLVDSNYAVLVDAAGTSIPYNYNRVSPEITVNLASKYLNNNQLFFEYHVSFYTGQ